MKTSITEGQKKQYRRFVEDSCEKALTEVNLDKDGIQKLIERGDEFQAHIIAGIRELSVSNQFADEEMESSYGYISGYKPKGITEQTNRLRELFPGIGYVDEKLAEAELPENAEGWFAIPRWEKVASTYGEAVQKVFDLLEQTRDGKFHNYRDGQLGSQYLRESAKTAKMFQALREEQKDHDILIVPAQFGLLHRRCSVRRVREVMNVNQFGLGAFAIGIMLLTHPERLQCYNDLYIDCAGDEFAPVAVGDWSCAPFFDFHGGQLGFGSCWSACAGSHYGSASGFRFPQ